MLHHFPEIISIVTSINIRIFDDASAFSYKELFFYNKPSRILTMTHSFLAKIAPNGRCGHLSDKGDRDFCDGKTRVHTQMTSAKKFWDSKPFLCTWKFLLTPTVQIVLSYWDSTQSEAVNRFVNFKRRAPTAPHGRKPKNPNSSDCADRCQLSSCGVSAQSRKTCRLWLDWKISKGAPGKKSKNPAPQDCANWRLISSYRVSAQSDEYCKLWIDLNVSRGAPNGAQ